VIRKLLLRVPTLRRHLERRWMPDPIERDRHREIVRARLEAPATPDPTIDPAETKELTES